MKQDVISPKAIVRKNLLNMLFGGIAGTIGIIAVYPIETVKTIIQVKSEARQTTSVAKVLSDTRRAGSLMDLYKGLPAAILRQFFFASIRLGLFFSYADYIKVKYHRDSLSILQSTAGSLAAATIGIATVMPFDVVFVRFQADNALPIAQRRGYSGIGSAMTLIVKDEGIHTLWRGILPAFARAMALNFGMLVPYDKCKSLLAPYLGYTRANYLLAAAIAGFGAAFCSLPFDNAKVKLQKMNRGLDGRLPYKGVVDCFVKCARSQGVSRLWAGFAVFYTFQAPHTMITLLISDALRVIFGVTKK